MKIAVSTFVTPPKVGGVGHYLQRLLEALQVVDAENEYLVLVSEENRHLFPVHASNFSHVVLPFRHDPRWLWRPLYFLWQNVFFGIWAKKNNVDLLHIPNLVPVFHSSVPMVMTLHDFAEFYTTRYDSRFRQWYRKRLPGFVVKRASQIITISEHSRRDLLDIYRADPDCVNVVYEAAGIPPDTDSGPVEIDLEEKFGIRKPYALYVGNALPHKNLGVLIKAFRELEATGGGDGSQLVFVGGMGEYADSLRTLAKLSGVANRLILTGYVDEAALPVLYRQASCFLFPSKYEGFGLPLLEAMQFGVPVVAARSSCLPEIAGNAGVFADPDRVDEWSQAIQRFFEDPAFRDRQRELGFSRCAGFSWEKCAEQTVDVYRKAIGAK